MPTLRRRKRGGTFAALGQAMSQVAVPGLLWYGAVKQRQRMSRSRHTRRHTRRY